MTATSLLLLDAVELAGRFDPDGTLDGGGIASEADDAVRETVGCRIPVVVVALLDIVLSICVMRLREKKQDKASTKIGLNERAVQQRGKAVALWCLFTSDDRRRDHVVKPLSVISPVSPKCGG